eukprot:SAG22_NODE_480_length_9955_cov_3.601258_3_plen_230_part_00
MEQSSLDAMRSASASLSATMNTTAAGSQAPGVAAHSETIHNIFSLKTQQLEERNKVLHRENTALKDMNAELKSELEKADKDIEDLQNRNAELEVEVSVIEEDEEANRSVANVQLERALQVEQDLQSENERLARKLMEAERKVADLELEVELALDEEGTETKRVKEENLTLAEENEQLSTKATALESTVVELRAALNSVGGIFTRFVSALPVTASARGSAAGLTDAAGGH